MNLSNHYYWFKDAIPSRVCDHIISTAKTKQNERALIGNMKDSIITKHDIKNLHKKRKSNVIWLDENWIYKELHPFVNEANRQAGWNFQWEWSEPVQFTIYQKKQFYGWHTDDGVKQIGDNKRIRKLSMTLLLSDPEEFEGGDFEFNTRNPNKPKNSVIKCTELISKGSLIVFPSFLFHRVTPVTKGQRLSLVMWSQGDPYR